MKYCVSIFVGLMFLLACKKDKPASEITPIITIESISPLLLFYRTKTAMAI